MNIAEIKQSIDAAASAMMPKPLPDSLPPVERFNPEMLPDELRGYVMDVAHRTQCPPDFCAVVTIACLAGVLGRKALIKPKQHDDWTITPNQWAAMIGGPSAMKSPALKAMRFPLDAIEAEARKQHAAATAEHEVEAELAEIARSAAKKKAKQLADKGDMAKAREVLEQVEGVESPGSTPRIVINDATVEKLGELLNENPNGLVVVRDELSGWLAKMQQEEYASDRAFYLEAFNGDGKFTYDRIGRGTVIIDHCTVSIVGGIQPSKLAPLVRGAASGVSDDGLVQRFQLAVWPDPSTRWQWIDQSPDSRAKERYSQVFYRLHGMPTEDEPECWHFTPDEQAVFIEWMEELHTEARSGEMSPVLESHLLKMPKTVCGLALLFALVDGDQGAVGYAATCRALAWADYLRSHAERLYSASSNAAIDGARLILKRRDRLPNPFTTRDVRRKQWAGLDTAEAARDSIDMLVDTGSVTRLETPTATKPRTDFYWHPSLLVEEVEP